VFHRADRAVDAPEGRLAELQVNVARPEFRDAQEECVKVHTSCYRLEGSSALAVSAEKLGAALAGWVERSERQRTCGSAAAGRATAARRSRARRPRSQRAGEGVETRRARAQPRRG